MPKPHLGIVKWDGIEGATTPVTDWLWEGYLAPGNVTLLASQWKAGKTTLLAALLHQMKGGGTLIGQKVRPARALVVTEEDPGHWRERGRALDLKEQVSWMCRPFRTKPNSAEWERLIDEAINFHDEHRFELFVIDPLACVLPGHNESNAGCMIAALLPLQDLTRRGVSVFILHHIRKNAVASDGRSSRGTGALPGFVDVLMELHFYGRPMDEDRRRTLLAWSRFEQTPRQQVIELSADGKEYIALGDLESESFLCNEKLLELVLVRASHKMPRLEILEQWPEGYPKPDHASIWRWLDRGVRAGQIRREGAGHKGDPFRYWLPESERRWATNPWKLPDLEPPPMFDEPCPQHEAELAKQAQREAELLRLLEEARRRGRRS